MMMARFCLWSQEADYMGILKRDTFLVLNDEFTLFLTLLFGKDHSDIINKI
jgi:hypothetical protein